ncbi:MAG: 5'/3'-nucleotidase SurE, partial [Candidatus Eiseniibacteriota bacterium]
DGVDAEGIRALATALCAVGHVVTVAPDRQQSASSHALTLHRPLRVQRRTNVVYAVEGTPTDCVLVAVRRILDRIPDLVVAGINDGPNMGDDVNYSGTVAAAIEGSLLGVPSIAVSIDRAPERDLGAAATVATRLAGLLLRHQTPSPPEAMLPLDFEGQEGATAAAWQRDDRIVLNVNVPGCRAAQLGELRLTRLGKRVYRDAVVEWVDPRGESYLWIGGDAPTWMPERQDGIMTDFAAVEQGHVSVTPLRLDWTDHATLELLGSWGIAGSRAAPAAVGDG